MRAGLRRTRSESVVPPHAVAGALVDDDHHRERADDAAVEQVFEQLNSSLLGEVLHRRSTSVLLHGDQTVHRRDIAAERPRQPLRHWFFLSERPNELSRQPYLKSNKNLQACK